MLAKFNRQNPYNPDGLVNNDYTGPPGKRAKGAKDPEKKKEDEEDETARRLITERMELMAEGLERQRKRLIKEGRFEAFEQNRVRLLAEEKKRLAQLCSEGILQYLADAKIVREAMWSNITATNKQEYKYDKAVFIF